MSSTQLLSDAINSVTDCGAHLFSSFYQTMLSYPWVVMRRQAQVNSTGVRYHVSPFTTFPVMVNVLRHQSIFAYWKGARCEFLLRGTRIVAECIIGSVTQLPRRLGKRVPLSDMGKHLALKSLAYAVTTPFLVTSFVTSVGSLAASPNNDVGIIRFFSVTFARAVFGTAVGLNGGGDATAVTTRQIPLAQLALPATIYAVLHYIISSIGHYAALEPERHRKMEELQEMIVNSRGERSAADSPEENGPTMKYLYHRYFPEMVATMSGHLMADFFLYPMETVTHRLLLQGSRTLIDDTDSGLEVAVAGGNYSGFFNCFASTISKEGVRGLYRGFGALVLQYSVQIALLRLIHIAYVRLSSTTMFAKWTQSPEQAPLVPPSREDQDLRSRPADEQVSPRSVQGT